MSIKTKPAAAKTSTTPAGPSKIRTVISSLGSVLILLIAVLPLLLALNAPEKFLASLAHTPPAKQKESITTIVAAAPRPPAPLPVAVAPEPPVVKRKRVKLTLESPYSLGPGDKIRINIDGHSDISKDYVVRSDGNLPIPVLGPIFVANKEVAEIEDTLYARLKETGKESAAIVIDVIERRPFYVYGYVQKPGAYPSVAKMTVSHALSIAGGIYRPPAPKPAKIVEKIVEVVRPPEPPVMPVIHTAKLSPKRMKSTLATIARLEAQLANTSEIAASDHLKRIATAAELKDLLAREQDILEADAESLERDYKTNSQVADLAADEIAALEGQMGELDNQALLYEKRLKKHRDLVGRGLARKNKALNIEMLAAKVVAEKRKVEAGIARAKRERQQAIIRRDKLKATTKSRLSSQLRALEELVMDQAALEAATVSPPKPETSKPKKKPKPVTTTITPEVKAPPPAPKPILRYVVTRTTDSGIKKIKADEQTTLNPGDVLNVIAEGHTAAIAGKNTVSGVK